MNSSERRLFLRGPSRESQQRHGVPAHEQRPGHPNHLRRGLSNHGEPLALGLDLVKQSVAVVGAVGHDHILREFGEVQVRRKQLQRAAEVLPQMWQLHAFWRLGATVVARTKNATNQIAPVLRVAAQGVELLQQLLGHSGLRERAAKRMLHHKEHSTELAAGTDSFLVEASLELLGQDAGRLGILLASRAHTRQVRVLKADERLEMRSERLHTPPHSPHHSPQRSSAEATSGHSWPRALLGRAKKKKKKKRERRAVPTTPRRASTARTPTTRKRCVALEATAEYYYVSNETHE